MTAALLRMPRDKTSPADRFTEAARAWAVVREKYTDYASSVESDATQADQVQIAMRICSFLLGPRRPPLARGHELDFAAQLLRHAGLRDDCGAEWSAASLADARSRAEDEVRAARVTRRDH